MKIFFDTEFIETDHVHPIQLVSIGLIREDGREYYAENSEAQLGRASAWVKVNVLPRLTGGPTVKPRRTIAREIVEFVGPNPEFWAYYADYDWVVLCQLYGTMVRLPPDWPKFCLDLKQMSVDLAIDLPPDLLRETHHAGSDARWVKWAYEFMLTKKLITR